MLIEHVWDAYNHRRYTKPWAAVISFDGTKPVYGFTGVFSSNTLAFDAEPGDIVAMGQKDLRGNNTTQDFYIVREQGLSWLKGGKVEALKLYREQIVEARADPKVELERLKSVNVALVRALNWAHDEIHHPGAASHSGKDIFTMIKAALALAKGEQAGDEADYADERPRQRGEHLNRGE